jgi:hypothetical protein
VEENLKAPTEQTREAVGKFIHAKLKERDLLNPHTLHIKSGASRRAAEEFVRGGPFPLIDMQVNNIGDARRWGPVRANMRALAQVCRLLDLDFAACAKAGGFPTEESWIQSAMGINKSEEARLARRKMPHEGPPLYFSHPSLLSENPRGDTVNLHIGGTELRLRAAVSVGALPGSGFIHMFPTKEEIDEVVSGLLALKEKL